MGDGHLCPRPSRRESSLTQRACSSLKNLSPSTALLSNSSDPAILARLPSAAADICAMRHHGCDTPSSFCLCVRQRSGISFPAPLPEGRSQGVSDTSLPRGVHALEPLGPLLGSGVCHITAGPVVGSRPRTVSCGWIPQSRYQREASLWCRCSEWEDVPGRGKGVSAAEESPWGMSGASVELSKKA